MSHKWPVSGLFSASTAHFPKDLLCLGLLLGVVTAFLAVLLNFVSLDARWGVTTLLLVTFHQPHGLAGVFRGYMQAIDKLDTYNTYSKNTYT